MKYHYVCWGKDYEYNKYCYGELNKDSNSEYIENDLSSNSKFINLIYKIHTSKKTNSILKLPFKKIWFKSMCNFKRVKDKNYCFVFLLSTSHFYALEYGFGTYLKKKFPGSKLVCYYDDLVNCYEKNVSVDFIKKTFDLVLSFDKADCSNYGFIYHQLVYSPLNLSFNNNPNYDICFIGRAKNRIETILGCYDYFIKNNLKCNFNIIGISDIEVKNKYPNINFCERISYSDNLKIIMDSRVILEVMQRGGSGYTLRTCEAIMTNRKLLTNNKDVAVEPFYHGNIMAFENPSDIDLSFIRNGLPHYDKKTKDNISPLEMIKKIEKLLEA